MRDISHSGYPYSQEVELYYLGKRDYVNGLTLFEEMYKSFCRYARNQLVPPFLIKNFKINSFVKNSAKIEIFNTIDVKQHAVLKKAASRMDILCQDGNMYTLLLFKNPLKPVTKRLPDYDRGIYLIGETNAPDGSYTALLNIKNLSHFIRGVVEANYRIIKTKLIQMGMPNKAISWAYCTNFPIPDINDILRVRSIRLINEAIITSNGNEYISRELAIDGIKSEYNSEICFFFSL